MAFKLDPNLKQYATEKQWEKLQAIEKHGSERAAAAATGTDKSNFNTARRVVLFRAAQHGYAPDHDMTHPTPDGFKLKGTSTLYDVQTGEAKIQWVKTTADQERQLGMFREAVKAMADDLPRVKPQKGPKSFTPDLMACYPVGDHHLGMLSWDKETGADYDLNIAEEVLARAIDHLVTVSPDAETGLITLLGDFLHYDSFESVTPTSRNQLDSDSRYPKMVRVAIRCIRYGIERALRKHAKVHVIVEIGNHDLSSSIFLMECLANVYEKEPRVSIDTSPKHFHYYQFGKNLIMTHHGHGVKLTDLPIIMATDQPKMWGETEYRTCWTGHVHRTQVKDLVGATVESFAILAPEDAWAAQRGYRARRNMKSIILHREFGEAARNTVNPGMF